MGGSVIGISARVKSSLWQECALGLGGALELISGQKVTGCGPRICYLLQGEEDLSPINNNKDTLLLCVFTRACKSLPSPARDAWLIIHYDARLWLIPDCDARWSQQTLTVDEGWLYMQVGHDWWYFNRFSKKTLPPPQKKEEMENALQRCQKRSSTLHLFASLSTYCVLHAADGDMPVSILNTFIRKQTGGNSSRKTIWHCTRTQVIVKWYRFFTSIYTRSFDVHVPAPNQCYTYTQVIAIRQ